jgi:hypothetical protein
MPILWSLGVAMHGSEPLSNIRGKIGVIVEKLGDLAPEP